MIKLDYAGIHRFVEGYPRARWDGWDVLIFKPTPAGEAHKSGAYYNGRWGIETRVSPDDGGKWSISV